MLYDFLMMEKNVLRDKLRRLAREFDGRVGICVQSGPNSVASVNGSQRFSLQSVMKLVVACAVLDAVDRRVLRLSDAVLLRRQDLSLYVQPLAERVNAAVSAGQKGYPTTLGDLVSRAVIDSDSAATDLLFARVGGAAGIRAVLLRAGVAGGVRIDRDERHLQTETVGLTWRPEYVDAAVLARAEKQVPSHKRDAAFRAYLRDPRDTATPDGLASLLYKLATGKILSPASTQYLLSVMRRTVTFPDRLKAGIPAGWTIGHKTGTSQTWKGVNGVTNDVGMLTAPDGRQYAVAVFIAESRRPPKERAALMAEVARAVASSAAHR